MKRLLLFLLPLAMVTAIAQTRVPDPGAPAGGGRGGRGRGAPQAPAGPVKRFADGKPDIQGIWDATSFSAAFDVEDHPAEFEIPAGKGIIVDPPGGKIPYPPRAETKKEDLLAHHLAASADLALSL